MAKKDLTVWLVGGVVAAAAVGYFFYVRKKAVENSGTIADVFPEGESTRSESSSFVPASEVLKADVSRGKSYIVVVSFADKSALANVQKDLGSWASEMKMVGTSLDVSGKMIGATFEVKASRGLYVVYPQKLNTYNLLMVKKAGTA